MVTFLVEELWRMACLKLASNPPDDARLALEATCFGGRVSASWAKGLRVSKCQKEEGIIQVIFFLKLTWSHEENYGWLIKDIYIYKGLLYTYVNRP